MACIDRRCKGMVAHKESCSNPFETAPAAKSAVWWIHSSKSEDAVLTLRFQIARLRVAAVFREHRHGLLRASCRRTTMRSYSCVQCSRFRRMRKILRAYRRHFYFPEVCLAALILHENMRRHT